MSIHYSHGDAVLVRPGPAPIIAHVCNDLGYWGKGFVLALRRDWPEAEDAYRRLRRPRLGQVQYVDGVGRLGRSAVVANMIGQAGVRGPLNPRPLSLPALDACLADLGDFARRTGHSLVQMPRIGCGLAGGRWDDIVPLLTRHLSHLSVHVYDLP